MKTEEMSAQAKRPPVKATVAVATGTVSFVGASGARIYADGSFVGNIPSTIPPAAGLHKILVRDGKSADRQENLTVLAGGNQTCRVEFPIVQ